MKLLAKLIEQLESAQRMGAILESTCTNARAWLEAGFLPVWALESLEELLNQQAWDEINDRFYTNIVLGTGGMRGRTIAKILTKSEGGAFCGAAGTPDHAGLGSSMLNDFNVCRATLALFNYIQAFLEKSGRARQKPRLVIAHDVRHFSAHFARLAAQLWMQLGGESYLFEGPRSTPQLSFTVRALKCTAGVVITASHNPPHDNGYKIYFEDGGQAVATHAEGIMQAFDVLDLRALDKLIEGAILPKKVDQGLEKLYLQALQSVALEPALIRTYKPKLVYTPIHGTGQMMTIAALKALGIQLVLVEAQMAMDPSFSTVKSPNPENAEVFTLGLELAKDQSADAVLATDPDADRMGVAVRNADGSFEVLSGNVIGAALLAHRIDQLKALGWLPSMGSEQAVVVKTFVTSPFLDAIAHSEGLRVVNTLTGFKYIGQKLDRYELALHEKLKEQGRSVSSFKDGQAKAKAMLELSTFFVFGAEESYGYLASDIVRDKDANMAVVLFAQLMAHLKAIGQTFDQYVDALYLKHGYYTQDVLNINYEGALGAVKIKRILQSYRSSAPQYMADRKVLKLEDFGCEDIMDSDGELLPKEDFFRVQLEGGYSYAVRGSGTEPKIKFYLFAHEAVESGCGLVQAKAQARLQLHRLKAQLNTDACKRAGQ